MIFRNKNAKRRILFSKRSKAFCPPFPPTYMHEVFLMMGLNPHPLWGEEEEVNHEATLSQV